MKNNVQINGPVYGGVHFHGRAAKPAPVCDVVDEPLPRASYAPGLAITFGRMVIRLFHACVALVKLAAILGWLAGWLMYGAFAVSLWVVNRAVDVLKWVLGGIERSMGGAPTHLIHVPNLMQPREPAEAPRMLGPGARVHELADNTMETDYVDSN